MFFVEDSSRKNIMFDFFVIEKNY